MFIYSEKPKETLLKRNTIISSQDDFESKDTTGENTQNQNKLAKRRLKTLSPSKGKTESPNKLDKSDKLRKTLGDFRSGAKERLNSTMYASFGTTLSPKKKAKNQSKY